jgi:uncharacterized membrane protein
MTADADSGRFDHPTIHKIRLHDLKDVLVKGLADFNAMPTHLVFFCLIYPIITVIFARIYAGYDLIQFTFPLLAGYTLIGPLVAVGMYELSRRRELGLDISRMKALHVLRRHAIRPISVLGLLLMLLYLGWLLTAQLLYVKYFGNVVPVSIAQFASDLVSTEAGWSLIVVGTGAGFLFAVVVFAVSVVSFTMILDRDVGVITAIVTSIRACLANPIPMAAWGVIVAYIMFIAAIPFFLGLAIALPVLGHSTWHLYRKVVEY